MKYLMIVVCALTLTACAGFKSLDYSPEITGKTPVEMSCLVFENSTTCKIEFSEEGEDLKNRLQGVCLAMGGDLEKCSFQLDP